MKPVLPRCLNSIKLISAIVFIIFSVNATAVQLTKQQINDILSSVERPLEDAKRDKARLPQQVLSFTGISAGDTVLDLLAGGGWYSELLSRAVGEDGLVYLQNDSVYWNFGEKDIIQRTKDNRLSNVVRLDNVAIADIEVADKSVDIVFTALGYHDLFFTNTVRGGKLIELREHVVDHVKVLEKLHRVLKDDGIIVVIDHIAQAGSGYDAANTLHRIDPNIVKHQFAQAGFTLVEEAFYLRNPEDNHQSSVFSPLIRGKTDRFIYKFSK
ncbi:hypothetical protein [Alteromonas sp. M12]|uniref:class I SAM-dependent methyltransferase n=1 Tax=Alteromonas sp. M12 TaxID=3135644 RepID=UPI00319E7F23